MGENEVLNFLCSYIDEHQYPPSFREIAAEFSISTSTVHKRLQELKRREHIDYETGKNRTIRILGRQ